MSDQVVMDRNCGGCRYWSQMIAHAEGGVIMAMCLSMGPNAGKYTAKLDVCEAWASGHNGAIDDPEYGDEAIASYEREDKRTRPQRRK